VAHLARTEDEDEADEFGDTAVVTLSADVLYGLGSFEPDDLPVVGNEPVTRFVHRMCQRITFARRT
jgi:hypothetical protein